MTLRRDLTLIRRVVAGFQTQAKIPIPPRSLSKLNDMVMMRLKGVRRLKEVAAYFDREYDNLDGFSYFSREMELDSSDMSSWASRAEKIEDLFGSHWAKEGTKLREVQDLSETRWFPMILGVDLTKIDRVAEDAGFAGAPLRMFRDFVTISKQIVQALQLYQEKVQIVAEQMDHLENARLPKHEEIETVYHASINALDLYKHGFSESRPDVPDGGGLGLGGSVSDKAGNDAISFTYDPKYALEIARWFKEVAMVYAGDIKVSQILRWAHEGGVAEATLKLFSGLSSACHGHSTIEGVTCLEYENGKWVITQERYDGTTHRNVKTNDGDLDLIFKTKDEVYDLYFAYLMTNKHRENPVGNMKALLRTMGQKHVDPAGIGVLVAEVDMADPDILHKPAERELRVPVKAIRKYVRFIGS